MREMVTFLKFTLRLKVILHVAFFFLYRRVSHKPEWLLNVHTMSSFLNMQWEYRVVQQSICNSLCVIKYSVHILRYFVKWMNCKYSFQSTCDFLFYWAYFQYFYFPRLPSVMSLAVEKCQVWVSTVLFSRAMMLEILPLCFSSSLEHPTPTCHFPDTFQSFPWLSLVILPGFIWVLSKEEKGKLVYATLFSIFLETK